MRVLVCGGRRYGEKPVGIDPLSPSGLAIMRGVWAQRENVAHVLARLKPRPSVIIQGAASGADRHAAVWARENDIQVLPFKADWRPLGRLGPIDKSAGPRRNQRMLDEGKPDLVVAFPGGDGTANMVDKAHAAGVRVLIVPALTGKEAG